MCCMRAGLCLLEEHGCEAIALRQPQCLSAATPSGLRASQALGLSSEAAMQTPVSDEHLTLPCL